MQLVGTQWNDAATRFFKRFPTCGYEWGKCRCKKSRKNKSTCSCKTSPVTRNKLKGKTRARFKYDTLHALELVIYFCYAIFKTFLFLVCISVYFNMRALCTYEAFCVEEFLPFEDSILYSTSVEDVETKLLKRELPTCVTEFIAGTKALIASREPSEEQNSLVKQAISWVTAAASEGHRSPKVMKLARRLLGSIHFTPALAWTRDYPLLRIAVRAQLHTTGERLHSLTLRDNLNAVVGSYKPNIITDFADRQDASGAVPTPRAFDFQTWGHEIVYTHLLRLVATALHPHFENFVLDTLQKSGACVRVESMKTYAAMVAATRGVGALRYKQPPRPAHNLGLCRCECF